MSGPPPPPPPPPPPAPPANDGADLGDMASALFAEINSLGEAGARAGLKKGVRGPVNDEVPTDNKPVAKPVVAPVIKKSAPALGDPICSISGKKWSIENQVDNHEIVIEVESMKHTVYVYRCEKSTIQIKGKVNSISIDKCKKVALVFEDALSQVEIVNSDSIQVQCTGNAPSLNIDGCQSVTYYMSQESVEKAMVITSKSAAINLIRPHPDDPDDIVETPIPEQFCTTFRDGAFVTEAVEHDD
eukprot:GFKZ01007325.1.p2 GENE.GFKZ01007325.1~~GFKZ01007325.1.p2  ORF type:complete len:244 (-),score=52.73 GFKZ01007325.1:1933-2664(-)